MRIGCSVVVGRLGRPTFTMFEAVRMGGLFRALHGCPSGPDGEDDDHEYWARATAFGRARGTDPPGRLPVPDPDRGPADRPAAPGPLLRHLAERSEEHT